MELQESIGILKAEKANKVTSRFPCRILLLHSREDYCDAVSSLKSLCDRAVSSDELFSSADVMPAYDKLLETVKPNEWVWLPGVSEYLRLFYKSEQRTERFAKLWHTMVDASSTGRIIIPLWNCDSLWYDTSLGLRTDERQKDFVYSISDHEAASEQMNVTVFSSAFEEYINQLSGKYTLIFGLREWYDRMLNETQLPTDYCLLTKQTRSVLQTEGDITIRPIKTTYEFIRENLQDGFELKEEARYEEVLGELFDESLKNVSIRDAILHRFNIVTFDGIAVMAKWASFSKGKRQLLKLWYQLNPDGSYLCRCFEKYALEELEEHILLDIFDVMQFHNEWVAEYQQLIQVFNLKKNATYFAKLNTIPTYEERLAFLTSDTREERIYILRMVGQWLKQDAAQVCASESLHSRYPLLQAYLGMMPDELGSVYNEYISEYKAHKLANTLPESDDFFREIEPDSLPFRYSVINQNITDSTVMLWIDGLGFEYLSLLLDKLSQIKDGMIASCALTQALLPTETEFNEQWKQMDVPYEKLNKLDKLAHKGVVDEPDYYACIEEQLTFFDKVSDKVNELLKNYQRVIVTGDHGASRLAARFFHTRKGLPAFKDATPRSHGRYCSIKSKPLGVYDDLIEAADSSGQHYLVFKSYNHFSLGGFAAGKDDDNVIYGEVHGGASPEEMIVPVVVFDSKVSLPLSVKWSNDKSEAKLKRKIAKATLEFSKEIKTLEVKAGTIDAEVCNAGDGKTWTLSFEKITPGDYNLVIAADGKIVSIDKPLTVIPALGGGGDF
jgi:hypothetical protein